MRCAAERHPREPGAREKETAAVRWAATLAAACLLAACTGAPGSAGHHARSPLNPPLSRRLPAIPPRVVILGGGGAMAGSPVIFIGAGSGGSRPKITVPPIPPAQSSLTIAMPLEAYQAIATQQQEALADASSLLEPADALRR